MTMILKELNTDYPTARDLVPDQHFPEALSRPARRTDGRREGNHRQLSAILFDAGHCRNFLRQRKHF